MAAIGTRVRSAAAAAALHALAALLLLSGTTSAPSPSERLPLKLFDVAEPPPAAPAPLAAEEPAAAAADAASPSLASEASPIVAPVPEIKLVRPPLIMLTPAPGTGTDPAPGTSDRLGEGSGIAGAGTGGGGSGGAGTGGATRARWIAGRMSSADFPRAALEPGVRGTVVVRYTVAADGSVADCAIDRSSGNATLDAATCKLILERYRYDPARDPAGRPVADTFVGVHHWWTGRRR